MLLLIHLMVTFLYNKFDCTYVKSSNPGAHVDIVTAPYYAPFFNSINGIVTFNTSEYVSLLCDKNSTIYSETDCSKVSSDEQRLLRKLMRNYEKIVRPVYNASSPVTIKLGLTLAQIFDMEEKTQILVTNVWLDVEWVDEFLKWDPAEFNGLKVFRIPSKKLWLPDLVLYNNAADFTDYLMDTNAMVHFDGTVFWPVPTKLQSTCKVDVSLFPFDTQLCKLKFGSWTYDGFQVDITNRSSNIDLVNYVPNGEWSLISTKVIRNVVYYPCCPEPFPDVTFVIKIRRRILFYLYNVIFPCIMLSALTLLAFIIPPDSGEKVALGITVLLAFSVFMLAVAENMPETSEMVPLISIYLTVVMAMTSVSVMFTVFVLNLHHRGPKRRRVPEWLRRRVVDKFEKKNEMHLNNALGKTSASLNTNQRKQTCDRFPFNDNVSHGTYDNVENNFFEAAPNASLLISTQATERFVSSNQTNSSIKTQLRERLSNDDPYQLPNSESNVTKSPSKRHKSIKLKNQMTTTSHHEQSNIYDVLYKTINDLNRRQVIEDFEKQIINEWRILALYVDRILFWIFLVLTIGSTVICLVIAPYLGDL